MLRRLILGIAGIAMVTLIVIFGWLVFGRYVLNSTPTWVEQVSLLLIIDHHLSRRRRRRPRETAI